MTSWATDRLNRYSPRDDIADIMVNGAMSTFIEVGGKIQLTNVRFRDNSQLMNICQRIVRSGRPPC